jgi:hypothetical protein
MFQMSKRMIKKIRHNKFSKPSKNIFDTKKALDTLSVSTADSDPAAVPAAQFDDALIKLAIENGDKKVKTVYEYFLKFEELCIAERALGAGEVMKLKSLSRKFLSLLIGDFGKLRFQHSESICLAVLLLATSEVKLHKRIFLKLVDKILKKKCTKLSTIKKSKCFSHIKMVIG